jgi:GAF domain-containing protein
VEQSELAALMAQIATELQNERDERPTVEAIVAKAVEVVADAIVASIAIRARRHSFATLAATTDLAAEADRLQYALGEGPCIETAETSDWVRSGDIRADERWPRWGPRAATLGVGSLLSVPLYARQKRIGALNLYAAHTGGFASADQVDLALLFAVHAAHALAAARLVNGLEVAVSSRHDIGVAQGILVERYGLSLAQAFDVLRRISSSTNVKVADIARRLIETGTVPTLEER